MLGIIYIYKLKVLIVWSNLSRYHAEQQWEEASHLMRPIFKLMRWTLVIICNNFCYTVEETTLGPSDLSVVRMSLCRYLLTITQAKIQLMSHEVGYGTSQDELFTLEPQFLQYLEVVFFSFLKHAWVLHLCIKDRRNWSLTSNHSDSPRRTEGLWYRRGKKHNHLG